jgi:hypothetical protein
MKTLRKGRDRAQEFRTLAEGYRALASPLARPYEQAAEILDNVQPDPPSDESTDTAVDGSSRA